MNDYVELRTRSAFSFLRGASLPEAIIEEAARLGHGTLACGDFDGLYGTPRFFRAAESAGIRPLVGAFLSLEGKGLGGRRLDGDGGALYVLVESPAGYRNLCRLLTRAQLRAAKGKAQVAWSDLEGRNEGLLCLAGGLDGPIAVTQRPIPGGRGETGLECLRGLLERLREIFPGRLWLDLQRHFTPEGEHFNRFLFDLGEAEHLPLLVSNDVRHATPGCRALLDVLACIHGKTTLDRAGRILLPNAERHLKSPEAMAHLFRDLPGAVCETRAVAERCEFTLANLGYRFPDFPLPPGEIPDGHLRRLSDEGALQRYGTITPRVRQQLDHELAIIARLGLAGYFLIVHDLVAFCRREGILAQGRGSAANSAVCYALGITAVDAVGMDLLFERFLSEERGECPDIDIDLPSGERREQVIQYVYDRYGERGAGMTANVITYRARSAVREIGKSLGFSPADVNRLSKCLRAYGYRDGNYELAPQLRRVGLDPGAPRLRHLVRLCDEIEGLPRHLGQHSGGMVISGGRLDEIVPLERARMEGRIVVQWDKDDCADLGIIKVDLLGLGMMAVLEDSIPLIRKHEGVEVDLAKLPPDDPKVYSALRKADTIGVFQVESRAQMATLPRMKPERFYDLVVEVAIIRPGPIVGNMVHPYLNRRNGREEVTYDHPSLEPILKRTLGVPLFQEQLLRMAVAVAGFTPGEAEELRRTIGFKRSEARMQELSRRLLNGMARNGITGAVAEKILRSITAFALYGFPESHAASFALLTYASAYLKVYHGAAFTCALLNNWPMGFYHPATIVKDAERHGIGSLPIDATRSDWLCTLEKEGRRESSRSPFSVRLGMRYVQGLREAVGRRIEEARRESPFRDVGDLAHRAALRRDQLDRLAHAGALAGIGLSRREAFWQVAALERGALLERSRPRGGHSPLPEMTPFEETMADYAGTSLTTGPHVMTHLRAPLRRRGVLTAAELRNMPDGSGGRVAGLVIVRQRPGTAKGFLFLTLEDETGTSNVVVTPKIFERHRVLLHIARILLVEGPIQKVDGVIHVRGHRFEAIPLESSPRSHDFH